MANRTAMNKKARQMIAEIAEEKNLTSCELRFPGCMGTFGIAPAHRFSRINYSTAEELADYNTWVCACVRCHGILDNRSKTTEEEKEIIFKNLRPQI